MTLGSEILSFLSLKAALSYPNSGCSLVTRIEKNVPNEHQSGDVLAIILKME